MRHIADRWDYRDIKLALFSDVHGHLRIVLHMMRCWQVTHQEKLDGALVAADLGCFPDNKHAETHIPVVAMTAHAMEGDRERCLEAGMDDYVSKPINSDVLFEVIEKFVKSEG